MHGIDLVDTLAEFLKDDVIAEYDLSTKINGVTKRPSVYTGYLPPKEDEDEDAVPNDYPFVIVRYINEDDDLNEENRIRVNLIIGTYSEDEQSGWRDAVNIATRIKIELKRHMVFGPFGLVGRIHTDLFQEQLFPYHHAVMELEFEAPQVQVEGIELFG